VKDDDPTYFCHGPPRANAAPASTVNLCTESTANTRQRSRSAPPSRRPKRPPTRPRCKAAMASIMKACGSNVNNVMDHLGQAFFKSVGLGAGEPPEASHKGDTAIAFHCLHCHSTLPLHATGDTAIPALPFYTPRAALEFSTTVDRHPLGIHTVLYLIHTV
jgi:hypothetical protein